MCCYKENSGKKFALLFSCPGKEEKKKNKPCAGVTGTNLVKLLEILNKLYSNSIPINRSDYIINNAWPNIEFRGETKRTEALDSQIVDPKNMTRLKDELDGVEILIAFGLKAQLAMHELNQGYGTEIKIINSIHLGMRALNTKIKTDINGNNIAKGKIDATDDRLMVVAKNIYDQW